MTGVAAPAGFADHQQAGFGLRWLTLAEVLALHEKQLARFGGPSGVRDHGMLESALGRPRNKWDYERAELPTLAAAYAYGIARNHPFVDGNKRAAFVAMMLLLRLNGARFAPSQAEATQIMLGLAASDVSEESFARWIRDRLSDA